MKENKHKLIENCGNCFYYEPDYGIWCVNGWSGNGDDGYCCAEIKKHSRRKKDISCIHYRDKRANANVC